MQITPKGFKGLTQVLQINSIYYMAVRGYKFCFLLLKVSLTSEQSEST